MEYIQSALGQGDDACIFCAARDEAEGTYVVTRGERALVMLNAYPYNSGHLMVAPLRHVGEPGDLEDGEVLESQRLVARSLAALREEMTPDGFNLGLNLGRVAGAGVPGHLHWHVVPRWNGDTNFMPVVGETRVLPESLDETHRKLVARF
jgi:ATP adenylyltransferase